MTDRAAEPQSCEELLAQMVGFNSIFRDQSGREQPELPLAEHLQSLARGWGFEAHLLPVPGHAPNLLITHPVSASAPWLLFDSHMDTVDVAGMTIDPFQAEIRDGRIYGRGACDTKGTGAAMFWALRTLAADQKVTSNTAILFSVDEENTQIGARTFVTEQVKQLDWEPIGAIVGEPTEMKLVTAANGVVRWTVEATGVPAHSCDPELGRSAISDMAKIVLAIERDYIPAIEVSHPLTGKAQCSINMIEGGLQINIIPEKCRVRIDRRIVPGEDPQAVLPAVEQVLDDVRGEDPQLEVNQESNQVVAAIDPALSVSFADAVGSVLAAEGFDPTPAGVPYATNGNSFSPAGLPTVVLGPGNIAQAHTRDEWLDREQLRLGVRAYQSLMTAAPETWT